MDRPFGPRVTTIHGQPFPHTCGQHNIRSRRHVVARGSCVGGSIVNNRTCMSKMVLANTNLVVVVTPLEVRPILGGDESESK
ncbi:Hypothetical predicted protein [Olea europaea subsp. europaea]|uniref:Uncharacterized protein n=1 Tax=Olea europaea subsp. europaea TaxID=158383 RepID=A0A8S0UWV4_OLEEU|nr:Hypothetical predicted protein [Olea europaea subsp. europaea]